MDASFAAINVAYLFYVAATIPKRIVPLRILLILASVAFVVYGIIDNNRSVVVWNLAFGIPQLYQLLRKLKSDANVELTPEEEQVRATRFASMSPREFLTFWSLGEERVSDGEQLITQHERNEDLVLMVEGTASITIDDEHAAERGPGNLLGEASFVTGDPASATVTVPAGAVIRIWPHERLDALSRAQPDIAASLLSAFARELSLKIKTKAS